MRVYVLGSGSAGNALLIESRETRLLVEAGLSPKIATQRLEQLGQSIQTVHGIVATHHHGDHFGHADRLAVAFQAPLFIHRGIEARRDREPDSTRNPDQSPVPPPSKAVAVVPTTYEIGRPFRVGALTITTVRVPHDAVQVAIRIDDGSHALGLATDIGRVTSELVGLLGECDAAIVEANHCSEMLAFSEYPDVVKRRIGGGLGHLSNDQAADLASRLVGSRLGKLWLGHLSRSNNSANRALEVVATKAKRIEVAVLPQSQPVALDVRCMRPHQLGLPF